MKELAAATFDLLRGTVQRVIQDPRKEAFRLVTGKLTHSPFPDEVLAVLRREWAGLLPDPEDALVVDQGQPFLLRGLAQWLKVFSDPDTKWLVDVEDSFASGVCLGVEKPLPRSAQVCPPKVKHRKVDDSDFCPIAQNYASADMSSSELETKFREEEALGRMFSSKMGVLREQYGDKLRIASMAAIKKPDGTVRLLRRDAFGESQQRDSLSRPTRMPRPRGDCFSRSYFSQVHRGPLLRLSRHQSRPQTRENT